MDPTETLIEFLSALQRLEVACDEGDCEGEEASAARNDAIGHGMNLIEWLRDLNGAPPKVSDIDLSVDIPFED